MGGKNHQPTSKIQLIAPSALLSKRLGQATIAVTEANNFLEDAIIVAMNHLYVEDFAEPLDETSERYLQRAIASLERSMIVVGEIELAFDNLFKAAKIEGYNGNPLAASVSSFDLKAKFGRLLVRPSINEAAWNAIESRVREGNVLSTLAWERDQFDAVRQPTCELIGVLRGCLQIARTDGETAFVEAVECNRIGLRQRYAQVFSLWNFLDAMFLYSALIMTELFYRAHEFAPLTDWEPAKAQTEVAAE